MATTSFTLTEHFEAYIKAQVETGRYATASDVMRDALRLHEEQQEKLAALRAHLQESLDQADRGEFVEDFSMDNLIERAIERASQK
ncbi:MAG: type II toxin-antitoxin system ParD family antitoxin [Pseudomonadota bacterium]